MVKHMKKGINYFITSLVCILFIGFLGQTAVTIEAASATLTFSAESHSVTVGDTFYVVLILDSGETLGGMEGYISYDDHLVEFITGGKYVNGGDGLLRIYDMDSEEIQNTRKYALEFKAKKTGECTFATSEAPAVYNENGDELSVSSNKLSVSIGKSQKLSKNNKLSKFLISPGELNQEYSNDITAYKTEIPYQNDMLFISAIPEDENAVVTVEDNEHLKVGTNYVHIIVTAQSGDKKDIQVEVNRLPENKEAGKEETEVNGITVSKDDSNSITIKDIHTYELAELKDQSFIPEGYEASTIVIEGEELYCYVLSSHSDNEFPLLYLTNDKGESDFYQYDRVEKTIQRFNGDRAKTEPAIPALKEADSALFPVRMVVLLGMAVVILILVIVLLVTIMKNKKEI